MSSKREKAQIFYGYRVLVAAFFCVLIMAGSGFFAFSLFIRPLEADLGWSRGSIMAAFTAYYLVEGIAAPFVGRIVDRHGARRVLFAGALIGGLGFVLLSLMHSLWQFYLSYAIVGMSMAATGYIPGSAVVTNWFKKRRGLAVGIMSTGVGLGGLVLAPLIGGQIIPRFGWSMGYLALAIIMCAVIIPLALLVIRTKPAELGLYPDGAGAPEPVSASRSPLPVSHEFTLRMAFTMPTFWLIAISFLIGAFSQVGVIQSQVPYLEDIGYPAAIAATTLGFVGLGSGLGKLGFGWLCDRIPVKYAATIGLCLTAASILILMNVSATTPATLLWLYVITKGLGEGSWLPAMSVLISTNFGLASYGAIFGAIILVQNVGCAAGPLMAGYMYDTMNTYRWAFLIFASLHAIAIPAILLVRRPKLLNKARPI